MRQKTLWLVVAAALVLAGCGGSKIRNARMLWDLSKGMSEAEVHDSLGPPITQRPAVMIALKKDYRYKVYLLIPSEPDCPETAVGNAMLSVITLGASAAAQDKKKAKRYRLYFTRGRYLIACPIESHPRACRRLENMLVRRIVGRIKSRYDSRARVLARSLIPISAVHRLAGATAIAPGAYPLILSAPVGAVLPAHLAGLRTRQEVAFIRRGIPRRLSHPELFKPKKKTWTKQAYRDYYYRRYLPRVFSE
ncbi:MAG: hypothetical protein KJ621_11945 [Proteobacteria bacterium]|nr:hypothetical protein [Pseudomonadota bacterium]MBU1741331.1 hypothetical protein [Pseudomonadota bacterium]